MNLSRVLSIIVLGLLLSLGGVPAMAQEATPGVIGAATDTECKTDLGTSEVPNGASGWIVDGENSQATFTVSEQLVGTGLNDAVGKTNGIIGTILIDNTGDPLPCSRIDIDLRTLVTDEPRRDARIQAALNTGEYPVATFIVTEIVGIDGPLQPDTATDLTLIGNLSINGMDRQVTWDANVTLKGDDIAGTATTTIHFDDFGVSKPVMGPVMSIDDAIAITVQIQAAKP